MTAIDEIVDVAISVESATIDRAGFGTPLIAAFHNFWPELVRTFSTLAELTDAGVPTTHPIVKQVTALLSQEFKPPQFKVGKRTLPPSNAFTLTPTNTDEGYVYAFNVAIGNGTATAISHTNGAGETVANIVAQLQSQIDAVTDITAVDNTTDVGVTADNPGELIRFWAWSDPDLQILNTTADPGIATDLAAIESDDPNWYGLLLDSNSPAEIEAAAAWTEARVKLFGADSSDTDIPTASSSDLGSTLFANLYNRTYLLYDADDTLGYSAAAWMGDRFPTTPGSSTWKFKDLAGVTTDKLNTGKRTNLRNKRVNFYSNVAGAGAVQEGVAASGQFLDVTRGIDWLRAEVQTNVFGYLVSQEKVPFTDAGIDGVRNQILAALNQGIANDLLATDPKPEVLAPRAGAVSLVDKSNRLLPDVEFSATLAGAIHKVVIRGKVSV